MEFTQEELVDWSKKLADFKFEDMKERTFLEIINAHQIESVSSRVLAFILDPNEKHGLNTLGLKALAKVASIKLTHPLSKANVITELGCYHSRTDKRGRIDILIEMDDQIIAIENKINHICNNPFLIYEKYINKEYKDYSKKDFIILGLCNDKSNTGNFKFVSHFDFGKEMKRLLENYDGSSPYLIFINDYLDALSTMDKKDFFSQNESEIFDFILENSNKLDQLNQFKEKIKRYAKNYLKEFNEISGYNQSIYFHKYNEWVNCGAYLTLDGIRSNNEFFNGYISLDVGWQLSEVYILIYAHSLRKGNLVDFELVVNYLESIDMKVLNKKTYLDDDYIQIFKATSKCTPQRLSNEFKKILEKIQE